MYLNVVSNPSQPKLKKRNKQTNRNGNLDEAKQMGWEHSKNVLKLQNVLPPRIINCGVNEKWTRQRHFRNSYHPDLRGYTNRIWASFMNTWPMQCHKVLDSERLHTMFNALLSLSLNSWQLNLWVVCCQWSLLGQWNKSMSPGDMYSNCVCHVAAPFLFCPSLLIRMLQVESVGRIYMNQVVKYKLLS